MIKTFQWKKIILWVNSSGGYNF